MSLRLDTQGAVSETELRQRLPQQPEQPQQAQSAEQARQAVVELNAAELKKGDKHKKTYGRTPTGAVFVVPETHDMVSTLFSPTEPKNLSDAVVLAILSLKLLAVFTLPRAVSIPLFALLFLFWRACYNGGIGYVLKQQSECNSIVAWAHRSGIWEKPESGRNHYAKYYALLKRELETKIPRDYKFDEAPLEYNTWLLFRRGVDLILMCDFTSYCCFAAACGGTPPGESLLMTAVRWVVGILLVLFNLWVKLDAHRVVKDYAWYWGDFFFLIDQELTFDGVFEMAPHPMYSVGYAGFYGISLMAASYKVLFISIIGHAAQFAFLTLVENPHIEKTYNPPPRRTRPSTSHPSPPTFDKITDHDLDGSTELLSPPSQHPKIHLPSQQPPSAVRDIIGIQNIDLHRVIDNSAILLQLYMFALAALTPSTRFYQTVFVLHAVAWRLWYSLGIGYILDRQSRKKNWTRHFIKYGETAEEAWRQWKGVYHLSMIMCHASFVVAAWKMYSLPSDWQVGMVLLRHVVGLALIGLHLWTVVSIYESLGEFGWFFGDFFYDTNSKLTYGGIYRFLNNPERVLGLAGLWGIALITWSTAIFFLALLGHTLSLCFIQFVEQPHMQKRYGQRLRHESGVSKTLHRSMPKPLRDWESSIDKVIERFVDQVEAQIDIVRPKLFAYIDSTAVWLHATLSKYPSQVSMARASPMIVGLDRKNYSLQIHGETIARHPVDDKVSGREGETAQMPPRDRQYQPLMLEYGAPLRVKWTAPMNHSKKDWIGLYMVGDNTSTEVTRVSSQGRWIAVSKNAFDSARAESGILVSDKQEIQWQDDRGEPLLTGEVEFAGDKLWWTTGVFEFRYHHDSRHNVLAVSQPFEVRISRFDDDEADFAASGTVRVAVEQALLPVVRNCFDRDPDIAPNNMEESFGALVEREGKFSRRVVYAIWQMFGIELAPAVVKTDGNVRNLAWRICNAKQVLAPYTMNASRGTSTPAEGLKH